MKSVVYDVTVVGVLFVALARFLATVSVERRRPSTKDGQPPNEKGKTRLVVSLRSRITRTLLGLLGRTLRASDRISERVVLYRFVDKNLSQFQEIALTSVICKLHYANGYTGRADVKIKVIVTAYLIPLFIFAKALNK